VAIKLHAANGDRAISHLFERNSIVQMRDVQPCDEVAASVAPFAIA
jgi:hypothetical protein